MFSNNICQMPGCNKYALSVISENDELLESPSFCFEHISEKEAYKEKIYKYIETHDKIVGLNAAGLEFSNIDLTNKRFYGCNFQHCTFIGLHSTGFRSRMSMFDFATFADCNLLKSNIQFASFGGATLSHVLFTGSDMIHDNFCGIQAFQSSFDDSDLYNSRFINAKLIDVSLRNCNLKQTIIANCEQENVSFKMSNTFEAVFDFRGSALFTGIKELDNTPKSGVVKPKGLILGQ